MRFHVPEHERIFRERPDWRKSYRRDPNALKGTRSNPSGAKLEGHGSVPIINTCRWLDDKEKR